MNRCVAVHTSTETRQEARKLARSLVESRLCACAHVDEIESFFYWEGALENTPEFRLTLICSAEALPRVEERISELHSYQEPAIYAIDITGGSDSYLAWIAENSRP